jgi:hypothetical protein
MFKELHLKEARDLDVWITVRPQEDQTVMVEVSELLGTPVNDHTIWVEDGVRAHLSIPQFRELHAKMTTVLAELAELDKNSAHG